MSRVAGNSISPPTTNQGLRVGLAIVIVSMGVFFVLHDNLKPSRTTGDLAAKCAKNLIEAQDVTRNNTSSQDTGLLCQANPFISQLADDFETISSRMDAWLEPSTYQHTEEQARTNATWKVKWNPFTPFNPMSTCQASERTCVGGSCRSDVSKITCGLSNLQPGCVVYSIGGNNQWEFELDLLRKTPCSVHTFDCTGPRTRFREPQHDRLHFHHVCLGSQHEAAPATCASLGSGNFAKCGPTWTMLEIQQNLGHRQIDLYKMDIEGFEFPLFDSWQELSQEEDGRHTAALPMQLMVEIHYRTQFPELFKPGQTTKLVPFKDPEDLVKMQAHLLRMGYIVIERDDNQFCVHCTELTLVRMKCHPLDSLALKRSKGANTTLQSTTTTTTTSQNGPVCMHGEFFGGGFNRVITLAHMYQYAAEKGLHIRLEAEHYQFFLEWFDFQKVTNGKPAVRVVSAALDTTGVPCNIEKTPEEWFYLYIQEEIGRYEPGLNMLRPLLRQSFLEEAKRELVALKNERANQTGISNPESIKVVTVHSRHMDGTCAIRMRKDRVFCGHPLPADRNWTQSCKYRAPWVRQHLPPDYNVNQTVIVLCADGQLPVVERTFSVRSKASFKAQFGLMMISDFHFGNPASSIDHTLAHFRQGKPMFPTDCYANRVQHFHKR